MKTTILAVVLLVAIPAQSAVTLPNTPPYNAVAPTKKETREILKPILKQNPEPFETEAMEIPNHVEIQQLQEIILQLRAIIKLLEAQQNA